MPKEQKQPTGSLARWRERRRQKQLGLARLAEVPRHPSVVTRAARSGTTSRRGRCKSSTTRVGVDTA
jgi:hypothetical protein